MFAAASGHSKIGSPTLIALRKKIRANDAAMTHETPDPRIASGACSRDDPQPKFSPPTITSPFDIFDTNAGSASSMQCFPSSAASPDTR